MYQNFQYDDGGWLRTDDDMTDNERLWQGLRSCVLILVTFLVMILLGLLFGGCRSVKTVVVETVRTDTLRIASLQRDSIYIASALHDSIVEKQRGDTILIDRWHTRTLTQYRDRWLHDSIYVSRTDSVPVPYPVQEYIEKKLTWWQQTRIHLGEVLLVIAVAWLAWSIIKKRAWWLALLKKLI